MHAAWPLEQAVDVVASANTAFRRFAVARLLAYTAADTSVADPVGAVDWMIVGSMVFVSEGGVWLEVEVEVEVAEEEEEDADVVSWADEVVLDSAEDEVLEADADVDDDDDDDDVDDDDVDDADVDDVDEAVEVFCGVFTVVTPAVVAKNGTGVTPAVPAVVVVVPFALVTVVEPLDRDPVAVVMDDVFDDFVAAAADAFPLLLLVSGMTSPFDVT